MPMLDIVNKTGRSHHLRSGVVGISVVALSVGVAGCGGSSSSGSTGSSGGQASSSASSKATSGSTGAPGITAKDVTLPSGTPGKGKPSITVGDKNFPEEYVLGYLYQLALQGKGYTVKLKANIGDSETIDAAFKSGQIDFYPEYLGEIVTSVAKTKPSKTAEGTYNAAKKFEESKRKATILKQTEFQDVDVLFTKSAFAKKYKLKSISDLSNVGPKGKGVTYVAQPASRTRVAGLKGLQQDYGLTAVKFLGATPGQQYKAIDKGSGNVGDAFSTDPPFAAGVNSGKYVALKDPKHIMGFQHVAPVVTKAVLKEQGPEFAQTVNWVTSLLTLKAVQAMDTAVQSQHQDPKAVAQKFLQANGLKS